MSFQNQYMESRTKEITLPSNPELKVKIKKVSFRTMILELKSTGILSSRDLNKVNDSKNSQEMDKEQVISSISMGNATLLKGMISPHVTLEETSDPNSIWIENISDDDYNFLIKEITSFSQEVQTNLQNFRKDGDSTIAGQDVETIQPTA